MYSLFKRLPAYRCMDTASAYRTAYSKRLVVFILLIYFKRHRPMDTFVNLNIHIFTVYNSTSIAYSYNIPWYLCAEAMEHHVLLPEVFFEDNQITIR